MVPKDKLVLDEKYCRVIVSDTQWNRLQIYNKVKHYVPVVHTIERVHTERSLSCATGGAALSCPGRGESRLASAAARLGCLARRRGEKKCV